MKFSVNITNFTCLSQTSLDTNLTSFMTKESSQNTFVGTSSTNGAWVDTTITMKHAKLGDEEVVFLQIQ